MVFYCSITDLLTGEWIGGVFLVSQDRDEMLDQVADLLPETWQACRVDVQRVERTTIPLPALGQLLSPAQLELHLQQFTPSLAVN